MRQPCPGSLATARLRPPLCGYRSIAPTPVCARAQAAVRAARAQHERAHAGARGRRCGGGCTRRSGSCAADGRCRSPLPAPAPARPPSPPRPGPASVMCALGPRGGVGASRAALCSGGGLPRGREAVSARRVPLRAQSEGRAISHPSCIPLDQLLVVDLTRPLPTRGAGVGRRRRARGAGGGGGGGRLGCGGAAAGAAGGHRGAAARGAGPARPRSWLMERWPD